jgi:hypothetical protein
LKTAFFRFPKNVGPKRREQKEMSAARRAAFFGRFERTFTVVDLHSEEERRQNLTSESQRMINEAIFCAVESSSE